MRNLQGDLIIAFRAYIDVAEDGDLKQKSDDKGYYKGGDLNGLGRHLWLDNQGKENAAQQGRHYFVLKVSQRCEKIRRY